MEEECELKKHSRNTRIHRYIDIDDITVPFIDSYTLIIQ